MRCIYSVKGKNFKKYYCGKKKPHYGDMYSLYVSYFLYMCMEKWTERCLKR